ncbi:hypothetical protein ACIPIU_00110 [Streptomyces massasporeus]|uniref:hypothetical protein n=1 Tax=Streptomyces massasporeus TaxID=67324 RepID=UPI0036E7150F
MQAADVPVHSAETSRARVRFDGRAVTVRRRLAPGLPWRPPATYSIARVLGAELVWLGGEGERRRFDLRLVGTPTVAVPVSIGRDPHRWPGSLREHQWGALAGAINGASRRWMRRVLDATVGTGPWSEEVWRRVEGLSPELRSFSERTTTDAPSHKGRTARPHREVIEDMLLAPLRDEGPENGPRPAFWSGFRFDDSQLDRARAEAWHTLIGRLAPDTLFPDRSEHRS